MQDEHRTPCPQQGPYGTLWDWPSLCPSGARLPGLKELIQVHQVPGKVPGPHNEECTHKVLTFPRVCLEKIHLMSKWIVNNDYQILVTDIWVLMGNV